MSLSLFFFLLSYALISCWGPFVNPTGSIVEYSKFSQPFKGDFVLHLKKLGKPFTQGNIYYRLFNCNAAPVILKSDNKAKLITKVFNDSLFRELKKTVYISTLNFPFVFIIDINECH